MAFAGKILEKNFNGITPADLERIAAALDLPDLSEESKKGFSEALILHGITDKSGLLNKGSTWFIETDFSPYGKGRSFAKAILGESFAHIFAADLERIAAALDLPDLSEESKKGFSEALTLHGITDGSRLLNKGIPWFIEADFFPYGKGKSFARAVLGDVFKHISISDFERIADVLFPSDDPVSTTNDDI